MPDSGGAGSDPVKVVVSVDPERFSDVVQSAVDAGLEVDEEMPAVGVVSGRVPPESLGALTDVEGVEAVERERTFQLPPPDAPVQ